MKIAILGYGKMGKEIERVAIAQNHEIKLIINQDSDWDTFGNKLNECDVAIEFSTPQTVIDNINRCFAANIPIVVGTTGWNDKKKDIETYCNANNKTLLTASNFSIGVNIFFEINKKLAEMMNRFPQYNVEIEEIHHTQKLDSPSGTAISIADDIISKIDRKEQWINNPTDDKNLLHINSVREGNVTGTHIVKYNSDIDFVEIKHHAYNRSGFALGAVLAAEFICNKKGIFSFSDIMK